MSHMVVMEDPASLVTSSPLPLESPCAVSNALAVGVILFEVWIKRRFRELLVQ